MEAENPHARAFQEAVASGRFDEIAGICDDYELILAESAAPNFQMLGHIYNLNLEDARFLWKRLPRAQQQGQDMAALFQLLQMMWQKDYQS
ncbi:hypothetical protein WJX73_009238 [Symbiochloris irregularis]|uniref:CSN8/PSMD8/EIF3K domain-containing protein n=1 Tax=Symbiochloris irregularis TaxID=706552 RepID=A0AAW1PD73_9CHLO